MSRIVTIEWKHDYVVMIDQRKLPHEEVYVKLYTYEEVARAIETMVIRGAPAIGVAAAMGVALGIQKSSVKEAASLRREFLKIYERLYQARPTAVNLRWGLERMKKCFETFSELSIPETKQKLEQEALKIYEEDIETNRKMGANGKRFIQNNSKIMTYCNTGTLATAGYGTALGVIRAAHEESKKFLVYVCETRPFLQGLRLTSWELYKEGIPQKVISDNMAGSLMAKGEVSAVFVGADRIAKNGDAANKIGTYSLAVLAKYHQVPFYVVAPTSTIDFQCPTGREIPIEERSPKEVTHVGGKLVGLEKVDVYNPSFDVTPHELITAIITEKGVFEPARIDFSLNSLYFTCIDIAVNCLLKRRSRKNFSIWQKLIFCHLVSPTLFKDN
ncbi:MAG: S-methyl-5-thioribose-1-phosphate isomerase [Deltaproteobacteria bacterium]|nr:S-methyl-5-thioribose-1-phosphate isomerase [Deltaproteobacteria bacterium]